VNLDRNDAIRNLEQGETHKYLATNEGNEVQHANKKEKAERECYRRAQAVSKTELNSANRIEALCTLAYGFNSYMQLEPIRQHYIEQTQNSVNCDYATGCGAQIQLLTDFMSPEGKGQGPDSA